jgi:hypothetical protein
VQLVADELISKAETLGLSVNAIYLTAEEWLAAAFAGNYDLGYGGAFLGLNIDNIFNLASQFIWFESYVLKHSDVKLTNFVIQLVNYYYAAQTTPAEDLPDLIDDMVDKLHDIEERLWEKQLIIPLYQSLYYYPGYVATASINFNSQEGRIFADDDLRITYSSIIDRSLILDFWTSYMPIPLYETYHLWGWSSYHNFDLPNGVPT